MKTPSDDIFQLIQAMTAAEKRYFKIHFSSEKSLITELFNLLNSMKTYDEEGVKKYFKKSKLSKNLKVYKIMLSELLLKSLSSFRYKKSINSLIRQNLEEVEILAEKKLYLQANKKLQKTKQLCYKHEEFDQLITILHLEYLLKDFYVFPMSSMSLNLLEEIMQTSNIVSEIFESKKLNHKLKLSGGNFISNKISPADLISIEAFFKNDLKNKKSLKKEYYAISGLANLNYSKRNLEKELHFRKKAIDFFKTNPHFTISNPHKYWSAYFYLANNFLQNNKHEQFEQTVQHLKTFSNQHPSFIRKNILILVLELAFHRKQKNFTTIINKLEPEVLKLIELYGIAEERSAVLSSTSLMMTHLSLGNHRKVQFYLKRLFKSSIEGDILKYYFEIVNMICHFETRDFDILQNLLSSKKRKIKRNPSYGTPFYKEVLNFFSQLLDPKNDQVKIVNQLQAKIKLYPEDSFVGVIQYFIFDNWMKALLAKKTYSKYINQ
ncbi:MAG: hypothetical protein AB8H03_02185 [Saprospiraceae bacterium]